MVTLDDCAAVLVVVMMKLKYVINCQAVVSLVVHLVGQTMIVRQVSVVSATSACSISDSNLLTFAGNFLFTGWRVV